MRLEGDIATLREAYRILNEEQRIDDEALADDFVLEQASALPGTRGTFHGARGMEASFRELLDGFDAIRFEPKGFELRDGWIVVPVRFWTSVRGIEQEIDIVHLWQMRDGRAPRMHVVAAGADPERALAKLRG